MAAGRNRALQRLIVAAAVAFNDARLIRSESAQTVVRLADTHTRNVDVRRRLRFRPGGAILRLDLPARYPAALRLAFEDAYTHPTEGVSLRLFASLARTANCTCDVGAHVGLYTYVAASVSERRSARIYAFEPLPDLYHTIRRNIIQNSLSNVHAVAAAAGSEGARAELCVPADAHYATLHRDWLSLAHIQSFAVVPVEVVALDVFFEAQADPLPDLVKIDVEGHEREVLDGMRMIIAANHPDMIMELIGAERSLEIIGQLTSQWGYRVFFIGDGLHELPYGAAPPEGELHNFLFTRRSIGALQTMVQMPIRQTAWR